MWHCYVDDSQKPHHMKFAEGWAEKLCGFMYWFIARCASFSPLKTLLCPVCRLARGQSLQGSPWLCICWVLCLLICSLHLTFQAIKSFLTLMYSENEKVMLCFGERTIMWVSTNHENHETALEKENFKEVIYLYFSPKSNDHKVKIF